MSDKTFNAITDQIVSMLEDLEHDWEIPWRQLGAQGLPRNAISGKPYQGINHLVLSVLSWKNGYSSNVWLTYKQAKQLGGNVRKGEKSVRVLFFKMWEKDEGDAIPMARYYSVFNVDQCDGLTIVQTDQPAPFTEETDVLAWAQQFAVIEHGGDRAFYSPARHAIQMPHRSQFLSDDGYHATLLHELVHWTKKDLERKPESNKEGYAFEELVAELGSVFMCEAFGIAYQLEHHASYLASWLKALKNDSRYLYKAARLAEAAAQHLQTQAAYQKAA